MRTLIICLIAFIPLTACTQDIPADKPTTLNPAFDKKIESLLSFDVPLISVEHLAQKKKGYILLDARELEEYQTSHIPGAQYIGYHKFDADILSKVPKDQEVILYCSIGYRSEKIGQKLQKMGFTNVYNLYGSIFEWVNQGQQVVDQNEEPTQIVHGYNKNWSKWIDASKAQKTW